VIKVGVLELQGNFSLHHEIFKKIGLESFPVKSKLDLERVDGLVIPGGESTTISLLMNTFKMYEPIIEFGETNPIMGTCAGVILMAKRVKDKRVKSLDLLNIEVERNAYGRQIESSSEIVKYHFGLEKRLSLPTTFIRAPKIKNIGDDISVFGEFQGSPVAVISGHHLGLTFHPEIDNVETFHKILFDKNSQFYFKKLKAVNAA